MLRLTCEDWRGAPDSRVAPLGAAEIDRWTSVLEWDVASNWAEVERGRLLGTVPGLLVTDESGAVVAWSYYIVHRRCLQIGGFSAKTEAATQLMLDAIFTERMLESVDTITFFAFADAPELGPALRKRGLVVDRYWYLGRDLSRAVSQGLRDARRWRPEDAAATADLLVRAYPSFDAVRPFAPHGSPEEWIDYVQQLTSATGCGELMADACACVPAGPGRLAALILVTRVSGATAHVAQLAVDPQSQRQGVGAALLEGACASAARAGCHRMSLLVGGKNTGARHLYEAARFQTMASFVAGGSLQPRRSINLAASGAAITRR